nr:hypothetical protein [Tanacetum cinerariifolium]
LTKHFSEEEDPKEEPKEEPEEDVDIELEDDVELIFPYEVEGDKTPLPGDVSPDSVSFESDSEDEEVDVALDATVGTITQKPYTIRDFLRGLFEVGESSSARDSFNVDGLAMWALRCDLEASHARARVMEAELGTCQTEIALLKSKDKIGEKERELLNHDLENVERALVSKTSLLELYNIGDIIMPPKAISEVRMREIIRDQVTTSMAEFVENMNCGTSSAGAGGTRAGGAGAGGVRAGGAGVRKWMTEEFCPQSVLQSLEQELYNLKLKGIDIDRYTNRFLELALPCPRMVGPKQVKVEQYIHGLSKNIRGDVTSSRPTGIDEAVRMAYQ